MPNQSAVVGACVAIGSGAVAALRGAGAWKILSIGGMGLAAGILALEAIRDSRPGSRQMGNSSASNSSSLQEAELQQILEVAINQPRLLLTSRWQRKLRSIAQQNRTTPWQIIFAYRQVEATVDNMTYDELYEVFGGNCPPPAVSREQVKRIPCKDFSAEFYGGELGSDSVSCPICLEEYQKGDKLMILPGCNHMFHGKCVGRWLRKRRDCPICRRWVSGQITVEQE